MADLQALRQDVDVLKSDVSDLRDLHKDMAVQAEALRGVQKDVGEIKETLRLFRDSADHKFWRLTLVVIVAYLIPIALFFLQRLI